MDFLPDTIRSVALQFQKERQRFPIDHVRIYLYQTLKALEYVHSKHICHRDLKPDNLLVDAASLRLKLIDFGCAKVRCHATRLSNRTAPAAMVPSCAVQSGSSLREDAGWRHPMLLAVP